MSDKMIVRQTFHLSARCERRISFPIKDSAHNTILITFITRFIKIQSYLEDALTKKYNSYSVLNNHSA